MSKPQLATVPGRRQLLGWLIAGTAVVVGSIVIHGVSRPAVGAWVWVEGERPFRSTMTRFPQWYDMVRRDELSGGSFISNWNDNQAGEAAYRVEIREPGSYEFWVRANPVQARLSYRLNNGKWTPIDLSRDALGQVNVALDGKVDLRFLAWVRVGSLPLKSGAHVVEFRMHSENHNHGYLDCFVVSSEPFTPDGAARPDQLAAKARQADAAHRGWSRFQPPADPFAANNPIDLRKLNEARAGDGGPIGVKDGRFVHTKTGQPIRFWAVNGPPGRDPEGLRQEARTLAKRGINLVRVHHSYYDNKGKLDPEAITLAAEVVAAMKQEGIYTHFSIYFPLWLDPAPNTPWLSGYNGSQKPFAALMFNPEFQAHYKEWWRALLLTQHPRTGQRLIDDPAVAGLEIQNEDSFFFWTFNPQVIPDTELRILEARFGRWLRARHGTIEAAIRAWGGQPIERDRPAEGRVSFRPLYNVFTEKTPRDKETVLFLAEVQRDFYRDMASYLRSLGFKGVITASNWTTASPEILGPIEKYTYTVTDFLDRHGYFAGKHDGENSAWSIREGQVYADRSALRFEAETPGKPRVFTHPAMDVKYDNKPSMISETTWNRPNRYRSEAPLFYAVYGALQGSDGIVHFALDSTRWTVKPNFFMQPWTLMAPSQMGQFPAAALIYRKGLVAEGDLLASITL
ncbi:MAG: hypothetical protein U0794_22650, partial [Isosphaeraceae bacterium]